MENCTQGALNKQAIDELKRQTELLFCGLEESRRVQSSILITLTEIKTIQEEERKHRIEHDKKFGQHLIESEPRCSEIKANTAFRKTGVWIVGLIFTAVGWVLSKL